MHDIFLLMMMMITAVDDEDDEDDNSRYNITDNCLLNSHCRSDHQIPRITLLDPVFSPWECIYTSIMIKQ